MNQVFPSPTFQIPSNFDGGFTCVLIRKKTDPIHETFPPGTSTSIQHNNTPDHVTIKNIPIPVSPILINSASPSTEHLEHDSIISDKQTLPQYIILLDSGTIFERSYDELIKDSQDDTSPPKSPSNASLPLS